MNGQKIDKKYLTKLTQFFKDHSLEDFQVIYNNEKKFRDFLNAGTFKFTNSGTSALYLIMKSIEPEIVWGPAFTHISWINCCNWIGCKYDFIDVREDTLSLDSVALVSKLAKTPKEEWPEVIVMVDMCGYVGEDTILVKDICDAHDIILIEDAAHAFGQKINNKYAGTFGDYGFYSFSNPKLLTCGEGGAIVSEKQQMNDFFEDMIYQGGWYKNNKEDYTYGLNFIMSNWMTELLSYQLEDFDEILIKHKEKFNEYLDKTPDLYTFESDNENYAPSFFVRSLDIIPDMIKNNKLSSLIYQRYKNMGGIEYEVSESLANKLVYWKI